MYVSSKSALTLVLCLGSMAVLAGTAAGQTSASGTAGPNLAADPSQPPIFVEWNGPTDSWMLQVDLIVDPNAGPMEKHFQTPLNAAGGPILLDAMQPFPHVLWEDFLILPVPGTPGVPVTDWHEEIQTPGWEWVIPGDARFPTLFPAGSSLITRNGAPWPWSPIPMDPMDPSKLWVAFPPIPPNDVLDIHKALLWVGTPGNRIWGDNADDAGATIEERFIAVREYPTIPEPAAIWLLACGVGAGFFALGRKRSG